MATKPNSEPVRRMLAPLASARLSFRVQRLEGHAGFAVAALALWVTVFLNPPSAVPWLLALYAAAIGAWARSYPAQQPATMFLRGALLQAGGWWLLSAPGFGGPLGPALLWPLTVTVGYGLLLPLRWSLPLAGLGLIAFTHNAFDPAAELPWQSTMAFAGALCALPAAAVAMGRSFRSGELQAESARVDPGSRLYNEAGFFDNGSVLFNECRRDGRPFTLVLLKAADLQDASELLGRKAANDLFAQTVRAIAAATPPGGLAARTDTVEFALAMPGVSPEKAEALLHQRLGAPLQVKVRMGKAEAAIVLDAVIAPAPADLHTLEAFYDRLHLELRKRREPLSTSPMTDHGHASTLHGLLLQDPLLPTHQRPTLPMELPGRPPRRPAGRPGTPARV